MWNSLLFFMPQILLTRVNLENQTDKEINIYNQVEDNMEVLKDKKHIQSNTRLCQEVRIKNNKSRNICSGTYTRAETSRKFKRTEMS